MGDIRRNALVSVDKYPDLKIEHTEIQIAQTESIISKYEQEERDIIKVQLKTIQHEKNKNKKRLAELEETLAQLKEKRQEALKNKEL